MVRGRGEVSGFERMDKEEQHAYIDRFCVGWAVSLADGEHRERHGEEYVDSEASRVLEVG